MSHTSADFMDGRTPANDNARERYCKSFCKHRKKHKCTKHKCGIENAPCDPIAEYMKQEEQGK